MPTCGGSPGEQTVRSTRTRQNVEAMRFTYAGRCLWASAGATQGMGNMRNHRLTFALCAATLSTSAFAQSAGSNTIRMVDWWSPKTGWEMASDDAFVGSRSGCYESLARIGFDNTLQPSLATSWTQTSPTTWEFTLRDNVKFQDGLPLNAESSANALNNLLKAAMPARAFSPKVIKSVEAVGDKVVKITTL
jgi:peptide/nickel transport system substrate-binding protein